MTNEIKIKELEKNIAKTEQYLAETKSKMAARTYVQLIAEMRLEISSLRNR